MHSWLSKHSRQLFLCGVQSESASKRRIKRKPETWVWRASCHRKEAQDSKTLDVDYHANSCIMRMRLETPVKWMMDAWMLRNLKLLDEFPWFPSRIRSRLLFELRGRVPTYSDSDLLFMIMHPGFKSFKMRFHESMSLSTLSLLLNPKPLRSWRWSVIDANPQCLVVVSVLHLTASWSVVPMS